VRPTPMIADVLGKSFFNNTLLEYGIFLATALAAILLIRIAKGIVLSRLKKWSERTSTSLDDLLISLIETRLIPLLYFAAFYMSVRSLTLSERVGSVITVAGAILIAYLAIRLIVTIITYVLETYSRKKSLDTHAHHSVVGIATILKVLVWGIGITFLLDNLGFKISAVIAGLGIGGIAVALAAQTILGDLFSYFVIFFDRPFETGDFIIVGEYMGSIEHIGIKTTRVRSLGGEQLVFSNTDLTNSRIRNYKRMEKRRIVFKLGVIYQTTLEQLKVIPGIIKKAIENASGTVFDRAHFASYGDFSLNFEVVYYVLSSDYNIYMDVQQKINFAIKEEFEKQGIEFAYPTQTLIMEQSKENEG
jgi:small-conductance mechanosensitive channel